jgi:hypothetical protein
MLCFVSGSAPLLAQTHVAFPYRTGFSFLEPFALTSLRISAALIGPPLRFSYVSMPLTPLSKVTMMKKPL